MIDDTRNNVTYDFGNGDYKHNLMLSGDFIDESTASEIASQLLNADNGQYIYHAFEINRAILPDNIEICGQLAVYGKSQSYRCNNITIIFGALQTVAQLSAPKLSENKSQYAEKKRRLIDERVKLGTAYGKFFVNKNGAGFRIKL